MKQDKASLFIHEGESELLSFSSSYPFQDLDELADRGQDGYSYGRLGNPTRDTLSKHISELEHADRTLICPSGMAAISTTLLALLKQGDALLVNQSLYGETMELCNNLLSQYGITICYCDFQSMEAIEKHMNPHVKMLYTEGISNPMMEVVDITRLADMAHRNNAYFVIDHTFSTPRLGTPLNMGADLVIHSLTKFMNGHSDVTLGSISGSSSLIETIYQKQILLGSVGDPFSCWLCMRGLKTLRLRLERQNENAEKLAAYLEHHPAIKAVYHPSLSSHPQHELAKTQYFAYGAMMSFRIIDDVEKVNQFLKALKVVAYVPSLGGIHTTLSHPVSSSHAGIAKDVRETMGIYDGLLRISVGIEPIETIVNDVKQALLILEEGYGEGK